MDVDEVFRFLLKEKYGHDFVNALIKTNYNLQYVYDEFVYLERAHPEVITRILATGDITSLALPVLPREVMFQISANMTVREIENFCNSSASFAWICQNWVEIFLMKYPEIYRATGYYLKTRKQRNYRNILSLFEIIDKYNLQTGVYVLEVFIFIQSTFQEKKLLLDFIPNKIDFEKYNLASYGEVVRYAYNQGFEPNFSAEFIIKVFETNDYDFIRFYVNLPNFSLGKLTPTEINGLFQIQNVENNYVAKEFWKEFFQVFDEYASARISFGLFFRDYDMLENPPLQDIDFYFLKWWPGHEDDIFAEYILKNVISPNDLFRFMIVSEHVESFEYFFKLVVDRNIQVDFKVLLKLILEYIIKSIVSSDTIVFPNSYLLDVFFTRTENFQLPTSSLMYSRYHLPAIFALTLFPHYLQNLNIKFDNKIMLRDFNLLLASYLSGVPIKIAEKLRDAHMLLSETHPYYYKHSQPPRDLYKILLTIISGPRNHPFYISCDLYYLFPFIPYTHSVWYNPITREIDITTTHEVIPKLDEQMKAFFKELVLF